MSAPDSMEIERVIEAAKDALTDEMVGRLTAAVGGGLTLIDQVDRAGLGKAIPAIAEMVNNGDLERLVHLARVYGSAQDALTDEMVGRLAETLGEGLSLLDRFSRGGALRIVEMLERLEASGALERTAKVIPLLVDRLGMLEDMLNCVEEAAKEPLPVPAGGFGGLWSLMKDPENQASLRFLISVGKKMRTKCSS